MKILFYDIKDFEFDYLLDKIPSSIEPYFLKVRLDENTYIDEKHIDCEGLSVFVSSELNSSTLEKFKNLKFIFLRCVGYNNVDLDYCKKNNICVFNTPNYGNSTVAEYTFALLLSLSKKISLASNRLKEGEVDPSEITGVELYSKTLGVIGAGAIGRKIINMGLAFGMDVIVYDVEPKGAYNFVELDEIYQKSDFISINCPLNDKTRGMINRTTLSRMKKDVIIVNTARGEIIETRDLYDALANKKIKGAALDVIECEEFLCQLYEKCRMNDLLEENCVKKFLFIRKMMDMPQVIITPHNAYNTKEAQQRILKMTLENISASFNINTGVKNLVLI